MQKEVRPAFRPIMVEIDGLVKRGTEIMVSAAGRGSPASVHIAKLGKFINENLWDKNSKGLLQNLVLLMEVLAHSDNGSPFVRMNLVEKEKAIAKIEGKLPVYVMKHLSNIELAEKVPINEQFLVALGLCFHVMQERPNQTLGIYMCETMENGKPDGTYTATIFGSGVKCLGAEINNAITYALEQLGAKEIMLNGAIKFRLCGSWAG